jgi:hypothetical protein
MEIPQMNRPWLRWLAVPLLIVAMFALMACGSDDDSGANDDDSSEDGGGNGGSNDDGAGSGDDGDSDSDDGDSDSDGDDNGDGDSSGDNDGDGSDPDSGSGDTGGEDALTVLQQTAAGLEAGTYSVVYEIQSTGVAGTFTFASEPPGSLLQIEGSLDGEDGIFMIIDTEDATYFCNGTAGAEMCLKLPKDNLSAVPFQLPTAFNADDILGQVLDEPGISATPIGSRTIAGIEAECYEVTTTDNETGEFCVGDGVILSMEANIDGESYAMQAVEVETDPGNIDIQVPDYPLTDFSDLGN